jgi:hypothetical protein
MRKYPSKTIGKKKNKKCREEKTTTTSPKCMFFFRKNQQKNIAIATGKIAKTRFFPIILHHLQIDKTTKLF